MKHFLRILYISGQDGETRQGQLSSDFAVRTHQAFANLQLALADVDASLFDIAVLRILVVDHSAKKHQSLIQEMQHLWKNHAFPACILIPMSCTVRNAV